MWISTTVLLGMLVTLGHAQVGFPGASTDKDAATPQAAAAASPVAGTRDAGGQNGGASTRFLSGGGFGNSFGGGGGGFGNSFGGAGFGDPFGQSCSSCGPHDIRHARRCCSRNVHHCCNIGQAGFIPSQTFPVGPSFPGHNPHIPGGHISTGHIGGIKRGTCPQIHGVSTGFARFSGDCVASCSSDNSCHGVEKCCRVGCSQICRIPEGVPILGGGVGPVHPGPIVGPTVPIIAQPTPGFCPPIRNPNQGFGGGFGGIGGLFGRKKRQTESSDVGTNAEASPAGGASVRSAGRGSTDNSANTRLFGLNFGGGGGRGCHGACRSDFECSRGLKCCVSHGRCQQCVPAIF